MKRCIHGLLLVTLFAACSDIEAIFDSDDKMNGGGVDGGTDYSVRPLTSIENDLLAEINKERVAAGLPALTRDPGMDIIERWYGYDMLRFHRLNDHIDRNGRNSEARARHYGSDPSVRCSEIIQWWGGPASGRVHYEGYYNSPPHHDAYMERGGFNLGPTTLAGVVVLPGTGPAGTQYEGRSGTYSGVMFCDKPITIARDPFAEP